MRPLTIIDVNNRGTDLGLILNEVLIMKVDTELGDSAQDLYDVANNLLRAHSMETMVTSGYTPRSEDWDWDDVLRDFVALELKVVKA